MGAVAAAPGDDIKRHIETLVWRPEKNLNTELSAFISEIFCFPKIGTVDHFNDDDLRLDVFLSDFHTGSRLLFIDAIPLPFLWRARVTLHARLYQIRTGKIIKSFKITEREGWIDNIPKPVWWKILFGISELTNQDGMKLLTGRASTRLLGKIAKTI